MTYSANEVEDFALSLPITQRSRQLAQQFATQQPTPQKAEQVWLNTLAVSVVDDYLRLMGISTNLAASDSWNPVTRLCADVADLEITGVGRLECRPIKNFESTYQIPAEVRENRIGYAVVQIDESCREATLLGFTPTATLEATPISQLQPIEDLIDRLAQLPAAVDPTITSTSKTVVHLSRWLQNIVDAGWQMVETLLNPTQADLAFSFRTESDGVGETTDSLSARVRRAKIIDLGNQPETSAMALVVELATASAQQTDILLQVHPTGEQTYLPPGLQLLVLDESGTTFIAAEARSADNYVQLEFSGTLGEKFGIKVALDDTSVTEEFVI